MPITSADLERARAGWSKDVRALNPGHCAQRQAPNPKPGPVARKSPLAEKFEELWKSLNGPELVPEFRFHKTRRWRFDYCLPDCMVAIELEGGIHKRVGHASPEGYIKDCEKYNEAALAGYAVFRFASGMVRAEFVAPVAAHFRAQKIIKKELASPTACAKSPLV